MALYLDWSHAGSVGPKNDARYSKALARSCWWMTTMRRRARGHAVVRGGRMFWGTPSLRELRGSL